MPRAEKSKSTQKPTRQAKSRKARYTPRVASRKPAASKSWEITSPMASAATSFPVLGRNKSTKKASMKTAAVKSAQVAPLRSKAARRASPRKASQSRPKGSRR